MNRNDRITLAMVCDNHLVIMMSVLLKSIENNNTQEKPIDIYIVNDGISKKNVNKINNTISSKSIKITWKSMKEAVPRDFKIPLDTSLYPLNTYIRLFLFHFLPKDVDKAIYLDVDMVVQKDISYLWNTQMEDCVIAAVNDINSVVSSPWGGIGNYKQLGLDPQTRYFNAGLLLIDLRKWREKDITQLVLNAVTDNTEYAKYPDQYGLNVVFANQWKELDPRWNVFASVFNENPYLIHYTGIKPLFKGYNYHKNYKDIFYDIVKLTPWSGFIPQNNFKWQVKIVRNIIRKKSWNTLFKKTWEVFSKQLNLGA